MMITYYFQIRLDQLM